jgi:hypothetical protein
MSFPEVTTVAEGDLPRTTGLAGLTPLDPAGRPLAPSPRGTRALPQHAGRPLATQPSRHPRP